MPVRDAVEEAFRRFQKVLPKGIETTTCLGGTVGMGCYVNGIDDLIVKIPGKEVWSLYYFILNHFETTRNLLSLKVYSLKFICLK
jgi:hypothetical protein